MRRVNACAAFTTTLMAAVASLSGAPAAAQAPADEQRWAWPTHAPPATYGDFGGAGLLQTPVARMPETGEFAFNYRDNEEYRFWSVSLQLYPWLQTTIRYADVRTVLFSQDPDFSGDQTYKDRGIDVQLRLLRETRWRPEIAMGLRDFGGTGIFAGEYFVGSKRFGFVDAHLGIGFGYLGRHDDFKNPFCHVADRFCDRPDGFSGSGGQFEYDSWFRGPTALFGGASIQTPWEPLSLKIEYDANDYRDEKAGDIDVDSRWNYGAVYRVGELLDLSLGWQRGNVMTFGFTLRTNFGREVRVERYPPPRELATSPPVDQARIDLNRLAYDLTWETGFLVTEIEVDDQAEEIIVSGQHIDIRDPEEAAERVARVLVTSLPDRLKHYRIVERQGRVPLVSTDVDAPKLREALGYPLDGPTPADAMSRSEPPAETNVGQYRTRDPFWVPSIVPYFQQAFGSPEDFYLYQFGLTAGADFPLTDTLRLGTYLGVTLLDNYDQFNFKVDSLDTPVPRVRTYIREYITNSDVRADNVQLTWFDRLDGPWYAQAYAGYLELMYGGVGGEVMYRPIDAPYAVGVDVNRVRQRSFNSRFGFRDYYATTGFLSFYYETPWPEDMLVKLSVGQYLAEDRGATIEIARRFDSGVVAGAYAAFTDVSSKDFGEGSFHKGVYLSIPLDILTNRSTRGRGSLPWIPLTRDGGQQLWRATELYYMTEDRSPFRR